jgi:hypothetical protein
LGRGIVLTVDGRIEFKTDKVKQVAKMIDKAHTFVPSRDMNELNYALQSKERLDARVGIEIDLGSMH